jgi:hypothetical protein
MNKKPLFQIISPETKFSKIRKQQQEQGIRFHCHIPSYRLFEKSKHNKYLYPAIEFCNLVTCIDYKKVVVVKTNISQIDENVTLKMYTNYLKKFETKIL